MTTISQITEMLEMLPKKEQEFACEVMKKLVLAWDADFTKLTPKEVAELEMADEQISRGRYILMMK